MNLSLARSLRVSSSSCVALSGAGGKTTAMFQLARQLQSPVIVTTTTHLGIWQTGLADRHIITETPASIEESVHALQGLILVTGEQEGDRLKPINDSLLIWLREFCGYHSIPLLIEADGSRGKPLKAWADHEPPIPSFADLVIQVAGLSALWKPLDSEHVHRAETFSSLSGLGIGEAITQDALVRVLTHIEGGLKNIPGSARRAALLNQADSSELQSAAHGLAQSLLLYYHSVIISSLQNEVVYAVHEPVAGIILAAGASTRFSEPKQLLAWKGQPFVRAVAQTALQAGLSPVLVVTGAHAEQVEAVVKDLDVILVRNDEWMSGQAASIRAGIQKIVTGSTPIHNGGSPPAARVAYIPGAAIFLLADQPQVTTSILRALVEKHAAALDPIIVPIVMDRRANPVLFDRVTFPELTALQGDVGGRAIFHRHRVEHLPWHDDRLLLDVDTPEMYQRLIADDTL